MADISGLLDTFFLNKQNPELLKALGLTQEQQDALTTQQNIGTGVGAIKGVLENWNQGVVPAIAGGYFGGSAGRQAPFTSMVAQKKTAVDISKGLKELEKLGYDTSKLQREEMGTMLKLKENANNPDVLSNLLIAPTEVVKSESAANPLYNKDLKAFASGYKNPDVKSWTAEDYRNFLTYSNLPSAADAQKEEVNRKRATYETGATFDKVVTKDDFLRSISGGTIPQTGTQPEYKPTPKPSPSFKQPENEVKQGLPLIESSAISPKNKEQLLIEQPKATAATEYSLNATRRIQNTARRLLDNPNLSKAFGKDGVLLSYIPNSEAASAAAELDTLKNQLFVQGITDMRSASQTGAAVGNVTEKEGARFENLQASLQQKKKFKDIVAELERLDKEMTTTEQRISNSYNRTYRPADFVIENRYERGSYKAPASPQDVPLNSPSGGIPNADALINKWLKR
jgi:hypothetical protein